MNIFQRINKQLEKPQVAELIQTLNKHRLQLTELIRQNKQVQKNRLIQILTDLQIDVSHQENAFDLKKLSKQNIKNIIKIYRDPPLQRKHNKKSNIKWEKKNDGKNQAQDIKGNLKNKFNNKSGFNFRKNRQEEKKERNLSFNQKNQKKQIRAKSQPNIAPIFKNTKKLQIEAQQDTQTITLKNNIPQKGPVVKKPMFFGAQKQMKTANNANNQIKNNKSNQINYFQNQKNHQINNPKQKKIQTQKQSTEWDKPPKVVQFVSASNLPKAVSVRKKFVPPFKKQQTETIKQADKQNEQQEYMDPQYKGLDKKLVETIELQILETTKSVKWQQIAGLEFAKKLINEMIVWPMLRPDIFTGMRAPPRGILLFGPPGTGKTMIGRAIASSAHATFFNISASSLTSKWVGQSQKLVRTLFQIARVKQPSVIFIDEIDSLLCARSQGQQQSSRRVKTQFLIQLDGAKTSQNERILIIGATNLPEQLDDAVRRRFIKRLYIPLPNTQSRRQLIETLTKGQTFAVKKEEIIELAKITAGFSGADIHALCKQASMMPLRQIREIEKIHFSQVPTAKLKHFKEAIKFVRPSVNKKVLAKYEDWNQQFGSYQFNPDQLDSQSQ